MQPNSEKCIRDAIGKRFDMLTIVEHDHSELVHPIIKGQVTSKYNHYFKCRCDCGNEVIRNWDTFKGNRFHCCGCQQSAINKAVAAQRQADGSIFTGPLNPDKYLNFRVGMLVGTNEWQRIKVGKNKDKNRIQFKFNCDCGNHIWLDAGQVNKLINKQDRYTASCGCNLKAEQAKMGKIRMSGGHCESRTRLYRVWNAMIQRCYNPKASHYPGYGARGIKICNEWYDPNDLNTSFINFRNWAYNVAGYKEPDREHTFQEMTIDRIDVNGDYCPENCRFTDSFMQANNTRKSLYINYQGRKYNIVELYKLFYPDSENWLGLYNIIKYWYENGYSANLIIHNLKHPDDFWYPDYNGIVRDSEGFQRLVKNEGAFFDSCK